MENPLFRVYIYRTETILRDISFLSGYEIQFANYAVKTIARKAVCDAKNDNLKESYRQSFEHITVGARAHICGNKIRLTLVYVGTDGDWDPDGCDGLGDIFYSRVQEVAKAFVMFIGGRPVFEWIGGPPQIRQENIDSRLVSAILPAKSRYAPFCTPIVKPPKSKQRIRSLNIGDPIGTSSAFSLKETIDFFPMENCWPLPSMEFPLSKPVPTGHMSIAIRPLVSRLSAGMQNFDATFPRLAVSKRTPNREMDHRRPRGC